MFKRSAPSPGRLVPHGWRLSIVALLVLALGSLVAPSITRAATDVCGPVSGAWTAGASPYTVTCDVQVASGATLTIEPGVTVRFNAGTALRVDGTLIARGATFTSSKATLPLRGDWGRIFFSTTSVDATFDGGGTYTGGSIIQDSTIEWGGGGASVNGAIETSAASPFIDRNTVRNNYNRGIYASGRSATS